MDYQHTVVEERTYRIESPETTQGLVRALGNVPNGWKPLSVRYREGRWIITAQGPVQDLTLIN